MAALMRPSSFIVPIAISLIQLAQGAKVPTAADIPASYALGALHEDIVWYRGIINNTSYRASGTLIRGLDHDWVLTAAHAVSTPQGLIPAENMTVGNGTSYFNDLGQTTGVSFIYISPTYAGILNGADYAFLRLSSRISQAGLEFRLGTLPSEGTSIFFCGYGLPATFQGETVQNTGNVMGFHASYSNVAFANYPYCTGYYTGSSNSGIATTRDSGGAVKTLNALTGKWENIGTMVAADTGSTSFFSFYHADQHFYDFLTTTVRPLVAAPKLPSMTVAASPTLVQLSCADLIPTTQYRVMRSPTLTGWQEAHRFTASTANTYSWSEAISPGGRMFYRLEWSE
jgi:hypothetical protein